MENMAIGSKVEYFFLHLSTFHNPLFPKNQKIFFVIL